MRTSWKMRSAIVACAGIVAAALIPATASAARPPRSPVDRIAIVTANVLEGFDPRDLRDMSEMKVFAKRVLDLVPYRPDVLLLQEVNSKSSSYIASVFSRRTGDRYVVVTDAGTKAYREVGNKVIKADMSIVVNSKTMAKAGSSGYIVTSYRRPGSSKTEYKRNARALVSERGGTLSLALVSTHVPKAGVFSAAQTMASQLQKAYPSKAATQFEVLGGDFNQVGVTYGGSYGQVKTHRFWDLLNDTYGYVDSGYNVYESKYVDYVFVRGGVWGAGVDAKYNPKTAPGTAGYYSDHQFRWAIVGPDDEPPTTPASFSVRPRNTGSARMKLSYGASTDNAGISGYDVYRSTDGKTFRKVGSTTKLTYYDESVTGGTRYWYRVHARDWSNTLSAPTTTLDERA